MPDPFHLKIDTVKGRHYARLVQSYWDGQRTKKRTLLQIGAVTPTQIETLKGWVAASPILPAHRDTLLVDLNLVEKRHTWQYGREALAHFLWRDLGLSRALSDGLAGTPGRRGLLRWVETMVVNRLVTPTSKYGLLDWLKTTATPFLIGYRPVKLHENLFYRAMDQLGRRQNFWEPLVFERIVRPLTANPEVLYHDTTSTYYEGQAGGLVQYGYNRDRVMGAPQVNVGMVVTPEGLPVTLQVYPGNTKDDQTVRPMRERLEKVFGLHGGIYVGDRGMKSDREAKDLEAHGFHWILAERNKNVREVLEAARDKPIEAVSEKNEAREVITDEGRYVVLLNEVRRKEELETLERKLAEGRAIIAEWRRRAGKEDHHKILKGCQGALGEAHLLDLFDIGFDEESLQGLLSELKEKVAFRKAWAGWWVLKTDTELPLEDVARIYQGLSVIEAGWREIKSVLRVRPLHHSLARRIEAHLMICELAYLAEKMLELRVRKAGLRGAGGDPLTGTGALL